MVSFCSKHNLVLLADEVYQENVYDENAEFFSCKRAAHETGLLDENAIELVSFHSISKGLYGECGRRGGTQFIRWVHVFAFAYPVYFYLHMTIFVIM